MKQHRRPLHRLISDGLFDRKSERWSTPASASSPPLSGTFKTKGCRVKQVRRRGTARLSSAPSPRRVAHLMAASRRHRPRAGRPHTCPPARRCRFTSSLARGRTDSRCAGISRSRRTALGVRLECPWAPPRPRTHAGANAAAASGLGVGPGSPQGCQVHTDTGHGTE